MEGSVEGSAAIISIAYLQGLEGLDPEGLGSGFKAHDWFPGSPHEVGEHVILRLAGLSLLHAQIDTVVDTERPPTPAPQMPC